MPGLRLLLTNGTATGRAEGEKLLRPGDVQVWQPWDTPGAVARFLDHFKPSLGILMETEMWPNLIAACAPTRGAGGAGQCAAQRAFIPTGRSAWAGSSRPAYTGAGRGVGADPESRCRADLQALGAPVDGVFGNLKFDADPGPDRSLNTGRRWRTGRLDGRWSCWRAAAKAKKSCLFGRK
jgi:3-deoxy-D-manno-octulosonic-acid transferase